VHEVEAGREDDGFRAILPPILRGDRQNFCHEPASTTVRAEYARMNRKTKLVQGLMPRHEHSKCECVLKHTGIAHGSQFGRGLRTLRGTRTWLTYSCMASCFCQALVLILQTRAQHVNVPVHTYIVHNVASARGGPLPTSATAQKKLQLSLTWE